MRDLRGFIQEQDELGRVLRVTESLETVGEAEYQEAVYSVVLKTGAETTPGPLILVTEFVGFLGAYRHGGEPACVCLSQTHGVGRVPAARR